MPRIHEYARARSALVPLTLIAALGCSGEYSSADITSVSPPLNDAPESAPSNDAADNAPSNDAAENALIESYLADRGFDTSSLQFEGDEVIVEGGIAVQRAVLLDAANPEVPELVEKGYFNSQNALFSGKSIKVAFAGVVSDAWKKAFNDAAKEWNKQVPRFSQPGPGSAGTITVQMGVDGQLVSSPAKANFPPNRTININPNFRSNDCPNQNIEQVSATVKLATAVHEMGHTLGFTHPFANQGVRITGTAQNTVTGSCSGTGCVSYSTVMLGRGCLASLTTLTNDDKLSAATKYPSCRTVCETNCLSLIDPGSIGLCMAACPQQCGG